MRPVPAAPTDVITNAIFGQSAKRVIERINTHPAKFLELLKRRLGIDHVPVVGQAGIVNLEYHRFLRLLVRLSTLLQPFRRYRDYAVCCAELKLRRHDLFRRNR